MAINDVPDIVISRLPIYLRALTILSKKGHEYTSSQELGQRLGIGSAQIRKDLSHFGEFGKQGTGYEIKYLREQIAKILHVDRDWAVALVGFGDLGQALAHYKVFANHRFFVEIIFDSDPTKIGGKINDKPIYDIKDVKKEISKRGIRIAIVAVPAPTAQAVTNTLIEAGIKAILNYAPITLNVPKHIQVQHIDPVVHLQRMSYYLV